MTYISYKICILGETKEQSERLLFELVEANRDQVAIYKRLNYAELSDGTILVAYSAHQARQGMEGHRFDEVFFGGTVERYKEFMYVQRLLDMCCGHSKVPPDFRWCHLSDPREETTYDRR